MLTGPLNSTQTNTSYISSGAQYEMKIWGPLYTKVGKLSLKALN
jgi:hypothetical protein